MIAINFILCSALLLLVYRLLLANEKMLRFNRIYLIGSLVFSLTVPFIPIGTLPPPTPYIAEQYVEQQILAPTSISNYPAQAETQKQAPVERYPWATIIASIYGLITLVLLLRFVVNLYSIIKAIRLGKAVSHGNATLILSDREIEPHSFLSYIFVNRHYYQNGLIEPQIICHEQAHAVQLHSADILFIELLQVFCWFNPVILLYRKAIQLNHEFLADETVIENQFDTPIYQLLLLSKSSRGNSLQLTSKFSYQTTKKRLIMMTCNTNTKRAIGKQLAIAPVLALALFLFSHKVMAINLPNATVKANEAKSLPNANSLINLNDAPLYAKHDAPQSVLDEYLSIEKKHKFYRTKEQPIRIQAPRITGEDDDRLRALYRQMSKKQQSEQLIRYIALPNWPKTAVTAKDLSRWKDAGTYGVWIDEKRVKNDQLQQYNPADLINTGISRLMPIAVKNDGFHYQLELKTRPAYAKDIEDNKLRNKRGGLMMANFKALRKDEKTLAEFTTDVKPDYKLPVRFALPR